MMYRHFALAAVSLMIGVSANQHGRPQRLRNCPIPNGNAFHKQGIIKIECKNGFGLKEQVMDSGFTLGYRYRFFQQGDFYITSSRLGQELVAVNDPNGPRLNYFSCGKKYRDTGCVKMHPEKCLILNGNTKEQEEFCKKMNGKFQSCTDENKQTQGNCVAPWDEYVPSCFVRDENANVSMLEGYDSFHAICPDGFINGDHKEMRYEWKKGKNGETNGYWESDQSYKGLEIPKHKLKCDEKLCKPMKACAPQDPNLEIKKQNKGYSAHCKSETRFSNGARRERMNREGHTFVSDNRRLSFNCEDKQVCTVPRGKNRSACKPNDPHLMIKKNNKGQHVARCKKIRFHGRTFQTRLSNGKIFKRVNRNGDTFESDDRSLRFHCKDKTVCEVREKWQQICQTNRSNR